MTRCTEGNRCTGTLKNWNYHVFQRLWRKILYLVTVYITLAGKPDYLFELFSIFHWRAEHKMEKHSYVYQTTGIMHIMHSPGMWFTSAIAGAECLVFLYMYRMSSQMYVTGQTFILHWWYRCRDQISKCWCLNCDKISMFYDGYYKSVCIDMQNAWNRY